MSSIFVPSVRNFVRSFSTFLIVEWRPKVYANRCSRCCRNVVGSPMAPFTMARFRRMIAQAMSFPVLNELHFPPECISTSIIHNAMLRGHRLLVRTPHYVPECLTCVRMNWHKNHSRRKYPYELSDGIDFFIILFGAEAGTGDLDKIACIPKKVLYERGIIGGYGHGGCSTPFLTHKGGRTSTASQGLEKYLLDVAVNSSEPFQVQKRTRDFFNRILRDHHLQVFSGQTGGEETRGEQESATRRGALATAHLGII
ncbi:unnamed protein product [Amoebophrya sp. A25]|nr:unnamed protein product [Amoebophrya sp. A25]|eukprot:GSA25T00011351001.1